MLTGTKAFESTTMVLADLTKFGIIADGHALWVPVHNWVMRRSNRVPNASGWKIVARAHRIINEKFWRYNSGSAGCFRYYSGVIWTCFSEVWNPISRFDYIVGAWKWEYYELISRYIDQKIEMVLNILIDIYLSTEILGVWDTWQGIWITLLYLDYRQSMLSHNYTASCIVLATLPFPRI